MTTELTGGCLYGFIRFKTFASSFSFAQLLRHMEAIKGYFLNRIGKMDACCSYTACIHVHRECFDGQQLTVSERAKITGKTLCAAIIG